MALLVEPSAHVSNLGAQGQINSLLSQIKGLRKQLTVLQKQLRESTDPMEQTLLLKQIMDLQRLIDMQEQQIANIQEAEKRKQEQRDKINGTKAA
jgi:predicted  nucleic acid-binding Zn-ribbon protein